MYDRLYTEGFIFIEDIEFPKEVLDFFLDLGNYHEALYYKPELALECRKVPPEIEEMVLQSIPDYARKPPTKIPGWFGRSVTKGFEILPHRDGIASKEVLIEGKRYSYRDECGPAIFNLWIAEEPFEGREFVWGKIKDTSLIPEDRYEVTRNKWSDDNLVELGRIKPKTGSGVIIDRLNPCFWHAVTKMESDSRVVTVGGHIC